MLINYFIIFLLALSFTKSISGYIPRCLKSIQGLFPYPNDCKRYYECQNGHTFNFICGSGMSFNRKLRRCDWTENVNDCKFANMKSHVLPVCPNNFYGEMPHPKDCQKFVKCVYGATYLMTCEYSLVYNIQTGQCDLRENVPGCYGEFGNGINVRNDVIFSPSTSNNGNLYSAANKQNYQFMGDLYHGYVPRVMCTSSGCSAYGNTPPLSPLQNIPPLVMGPLPPAETPWKPFYDKTDSEMKDTNTKNDQSTERSKYETTLTSSSIIGNTNTETVTEDDNNEPKIVIGTTEGHKYAIATTTKIPEIEITESNTLNKNDKTNLNESSTVTAASDYNNSNELKNTEFTSEPDMKIENITKTPNGEKFTTIYPLTGLPETTQHNASGEEKIATTVSTIKDKVTTNNIFKVSESRETADDGLLVIGLTTAPPVPKNTLTIETSSKSGPVFSFQTLEKLEGVNNNEENKKIENNKDKMESNTDKALNNYFTKQNISEKVPEATESSSVTFNNLNNTKRNNSKYFFHSGWKITNALGYNEYNVDHPIEINDNYSKVQSYSDNKDNKNDTMQNKEIRSIEQLFLNDKAVNKNASQSSLTSSTDVDIILLESQDDARQIKRVNDLTKQTLRLNGGPAPHHGYVEIHRGHSNWELVGLYKEKWTLTKAHTICKKLGYKKGAQMAWTGLRNDDIIPKSAITASINCRDSITKFQNCKIEDDIKSITRRDVIGAKCILNSNAFCSKDETSFQQNCYHLINSSLNFNHDDAIQHCSLRNSSLLYITKPNENDFISFWLMQKYPHVKSVMTGGIGFTSLHETMWFWQDSSKSLFTFTKWWPELKIKPSSRVSCVVMKRQFPCRNQLDSNCEINYFFWDIEDCAKSMKGHYYICKRTLI